MSRDSSVGIATGYRLGGLDLIPSRGKIFLLYSTESKPALGPTQPSIQWVLGVFSPGVKHPESEADHSPPSIAEVKNGGAIPPLLYMFSWRGTYSIKPRQNLTLCPYEIEFLLILIRDKLCIETFMKAMSM
jgi:hypothetical protein